MTDNTSSVFIGRFPIGRIDVTPELSQTALRYKLNLIPYLLRHTEGDWGDVTRTERRWNDDAVLNGGDLYSIYEVEAGIRVLVVTYADRSATALMLAHEVLQN